VNGAPGHRGRFITLEGGEGVGKSTQLRLLARALRERGVEVVETREPGGTEGAEAIRALLLEGAADRWNARAETLLFAAARADHVAKLIRPALDRGAWVLCDRFIDSNRAYQAQASGVADTDVMAAHAIGSGGLMPDRTLLLSLPLEIASRRAALRDAGRTDRFGARGQEFHQRVCAAFMAQAEREPERFRIIDASASENEVAARLLDAIADLLP
jgi:dTMP kinase